MIGGLPLPPPGALLVVSPHLDDAVLSCSALLDRAEPIDVLTVFTGAPDPPVRASWDKLTGFEDSAQSMAARREEDRVAFRDTRHRVRYLDLLEREYSPHPRPSSDLETIASAVGEWSERAGGGVVAVPAGAGRRPGRVGAKIESLLGPRRGTPPHPDHLLVRDTAVAALEPHPTSGILLYEELPYAFDGAADREVSALASRCGVRAIPCSVEVDTGRKARRIAA